MMIQSRSPVFTRFFKVWFMVLAGLSMITACGGGSGPSSASAPKGPATSISSPAGTYFKEGENIVFSGTATDSGGGKLTGNALVWTSNVDGQIGTGETLITSTLSAGDHQITLTATDSAGVSSAVVLPQISVAKTRFLKMGSHTTGVPDASNAFDGDEDTAATMMTPDAEFIHFKAYIGASETFLFKIKMGKATIGSQIAIQGLTTSGAWQPIDSIDLDSEKTATVKVSNAQTYKDAESYINLRARWEGGASGDVATIFEIWRIDPVYAGPQTIGVNNSEAAFDGSSDSNSSAKIINPWGAGGNYDFLHFKAYAGPLDRFIFNILTNSIANDQFLAIDVEASPGNWTVLETLPLNSASAKRITVTSVQSYLDAEGYLSLRARWVGYALANNLEIYEISRIDPFTVGSGTIDDAQYIANPQNAVDGDPDSATTLYYYWGESDRHDALYLQTYLGDLAVSSLSLIVAPSDFGSQSELIIEGEIEPGTWSIIESMALAIYMETPIEISNARQYIDASGLLNLRIRWESDSSQYDALIYEIQNTAK